jgi:hypothetical protein
MHVNMKLENLIFPSMNSKSTQLFNKNIKAIDTDLFFRKVNNRKGEQRKCRH